MTRITKAQSGKAKYWKFGMASAGALALSACANTIPPNTSSVPPQIVTSPPPITTTTPPPETPTASAPLNAREAGVYAAQSFDMLGVTADGARAALKGFVVSCPALLKRTDTSGLTVNADWSEACAAAKTFTGSDARDFFRMYLTPVRIGEGKAFATGYYIPEIAGSRTKQPGYTTPIYKAPADIVRVDLGLFEDEWKGKRISGRVAGGKFVPYYSRGEIVNGALDGKGLVLAYAADPVELFFLHVQGSGNLRLPDGSVMRIGYDGGNGRDYVGIGKLLKDRGALGPGQTSMQGIMDYLRADPARGAAVMDENPSYIFFRELKGNAVGAIGTEVIGHVTVAADPKFIPLGAPVWLDLDRNEADGLWVAQDTGGAIKGANRVDTFWGAGDAARVTAGGMTGRGAGLIFLPKAVATRLMASQ